MVIVLACILALVNFAGSYLTSKSQWIITILNILLLSFIIGLSYEVADYSNYSYKYYHSSLLDDNILSTDIGYTFLNELSYMFGWEYDEFRYILDLFLLSILFCVLHKMIGNTYYIAPLFTIYPMGYDAIQVRNFIIEVMIVLAVYIYSNAQKSQLKKAATLIIIAAFFHKSAVLFLGIFVIDYLLKNKKIIFLRCLLLIGLLMPLYANYIIANNMAILLLASNVDNIGHYKYYIIDDYASRHITTWVVFLLYCFIYRLLLKRVSIYNVTNLFVVNFITCLKYLLMLICILLPFVPIFQDLDRLLRIVTIPLYVLIIYYIQSLHYKYNKIFSYTLLLIFSLVICYVKLYHGVPELLDSIIDNNHFDDCFK